MANYYLIIKCIAFNSDRHFSKKNWNFFLEMKPGVILMEGTYFVLVELLVNKNLCAKF